MPNLPPSTRPRCPHCLRALRTCICKWVTPVTTQTEVLILQHPLEVHQAKGSGRLLHLNLTTSRIVVGETFDHATLHDLLYSSLDGTKRQPVLLYPDTPSMPATQIAPDLPAHQITLVVLDATWKKSRKMLYANPQLQSLPRLQLQETPVSQYHIRKAHRPDQLSTYEATVLGLSQIEPVPEKDATLLNAFNGFIDEQMSYIPEA
jgi:DTW domain-containing protein YfiP